MSLTQNGATYGKQYTIVQPMFLAQMSVNTAMAAPRFRLKAVKFVIEIEGVGSFLAHTNHIFLMWS
jgi:hypothetical protein